MMRSIRHLPFKATRQPPKTTTPFPRLMQTKSPSGAYTPYVESSYKTIAAQTAGILGAFGVLTYAFTSILPSKKAVRLDSNSSAGSEVDGQSAFLHATSGNKKDVNKSIWSREEVTVVIVIGGPKGGKSEQAKRIANRFDMQYEAADSDIYSDIALNLPTSHLSSPHQVQQLRIIVDDFAATSPDPLAQALQFEKDIAPILCFLFVDCPVDDAVKRVKGDEVEGVRKSYAEWETRFRPLINHYRNKANFLEITGEWPADEQWEQVEAKLESALELEARGDL